VLGFSKSITIEIERSFNMSNFEILAAGPVVNDRRSFREAIPLVECWIPYCDAFAMDEA
jgi:hypothetical protein